MTKKEQLGPFYPPVPVGWGNDFLTNHFQLAHENRYATLDNFEPQCAELTEMADALNSYWPTLIDPRPEASASLLMRAHLLFANVCEMAYSTQVFASVVLARTALEAAGYASLIAIDSEAEKLWHERNRSKSSESKARKYFTASRIRDSLNSHHLELASTYWRLYNTAIDFGAHPNIAGISANSNVRQTEDGFLVEQLALTANRELINFGLKIAFDVGCCVVGTTTYLFDKHASTKELSDKVAAILAKHNIRLSQPGE